ncbi:MAG: AAA family ATPase [Candidatus Latescibacterota bacterium]
MNTISRLRIDRFRWLHAIDLSARPLMVLIGANGVGMTSLLDALSLLSASAAGGLGRKLSELGGLGSIATRSIDAKEVSLSVDMEVPGQSPLEYEISLAPKGTGYSVLDVGPRAPIKLPQQMKPATSPGADGGDLVPHLYCLRETEAARFDAIVDSLKSAFGGLEGLSFPPVAAGMLTLAWKDRGSPGPFHMHELSEGTLRFPWLASLLQSPALSTITMIDEPEVSLHPELLSLLADLMREAAQRTQLVVATHSDRFSWGTCTRAWGTGS